MKKLKTCWMPVIVLLLIAGCGLEGPIPRKQGDATANKAAEQPAADAKASEKTNEKAAGGEKRPGTVREKAAVGMGEKGRGYGGDMISVPVMAMWRAKERIILDQMHHALDLYKAENGHAPKTHKEFMEKIVTANHLELPTLPAGQRYVYDPSTEELMVERPNDPQGP